MGQVCGLNCDNREGSCISEEPASDVMLSSGTARGW